MGTSPLLLILEVAAAIAVLAGIVVVMLRSQRRHATQLARVIERLEHLESAGLLVAAAPATPTEHRDQDDDDETNPCRATDVLAGLTSHVRQMVEEGSVTPATLADEAIVCVYRHLDEPLAPNALAGELCVSLRSLERGLAAGLACTPRELIRTVKMREAHKLLSQGRLNVAEVALHVGFSSPFHFCRRFKEFFGVAPSVVRPDPGELIRSARR